MSDRMVRLIATDFTVVARRYFNSFDRNDVLFAHDLMCYAHDGQKRDNAHDYRTHPEDIAKAMIAAGIRRADYISLALLHDVFEDCAFFTRADVARISHMLGDDIVDELHTMSKVYKNPDIARPKTIDFYQALRHASRRVKIVKMFDRFDNLRDVEQGHIKADKRTRLKDSTRAHYLPMAHEMLAAMNRTDEMRHAAEFLLAAFNRLCKG